MSQRGPKLPDFGSPPVAETVIGYSFSPVPGWDLRYFGLLWNAVSSEFPTFQVQPPIVEASTTTSRVGLANLIVRAVGVTEPPVRCWYVDASETRLLQIQNDRFLHNWRKVSGAETYPRYEGDIRPRFLREWDRFLTFLSQHHLPAPELRSWEVTYVNHLQKGREWNSFDDIGSILRGWNIQDFLPSLAAPSVLQLNMSFPTDSDSKLTVSVQPGSHRATGREVLVISLTANGRAASPEEAIRGIDHGRATIVTAFAEMTTERMHKLWQRKE